MSTKPKDVTERDLAYVADTRDLIKDVLASNNIPDDIALSALSSTIMDMLIKGTKGPSELSRKVIVFCDIFEETAVKIILTHLNKKAK